MTSSIVNHYKTLGVSPTATEAEIKAKYRSLVLKHHPDVSEAEDAQTTFLRLQEAFDVLSDEASRARYDEELRVASAPLFRGESWPTTTRRTKYANTSPRYSRNPEDDAKFHNIPEWERMHYGIGQVSPPKPDDWPTGEKEHHLNDHQLYFKYRSERLKRGGHYFWSRKFSSVTMIGAVIRFI